MEIAHQLVTVRGICPTGCSKRPTFSPAQPDVLLTHPPSDCCALDFPRRAMTANGCSKPSFSRGGWDGPNCAHHEGSFQACSCLFLWNGTYDGPTAPVERGPSEGARSGSTGSARVSFRAPLSCGVREYRAHPATPPLFFSILLSLVGFKSRNGQSVVAPTIGASDESPIFEYVHLPERECGGMGLETPSELGQSFLSLRAIFR